MDLMRILRSLEEFLYELVGWLVFYPRTFWRVLRHPAAIARYTQLELEQEPEHQFTETISPVLMLILSVVLAHALEMLSRQPPFVLLLSAGVLLARMDDFWGRTTGIAIAVLGGCWYLWARASAYRALVESSWIIALLRVGMAFFITSCVVVALVGLALS